MATVKGAAKRKKVIEQIPGVPVYPGAEILPRRGRYGLKDYAPDGSTEQQEKLHASKTDVVLLHESERVSALRTLSVGLWRPDRNLVQVLFGKGATLNSCGFHDKQEKTHFLYPEEALYLVERGGFELYDGEHALSFQEASALLMNNDMLQTEYLAYVYLKRLGYHVLRRTQYLQYKASRTSDISKNAAASNGEPSAKRTKQSQEDKYQPSASIWQGLFASLSHRISSIWSSFESTLSPVASLLTPAYMDAAPLATAADRTNMADVLARTKIIQQIRMVQRRLNLAQYTELPRAPVDGKPHVCRIAFNVYRPTGSFKKTAPGTPDFAVVVCSYQDPVPRLAELEALTQEAAPSALKFAVEDGGILSMCGLLDLGLATYGPEDMSLS
eukprot:m.156097 g.156097  ORF g.156097 m.156097 type:complete len:386 (-) comp16429_c0_seq10:1170-2327(-)